MIQWWQSLSLTGQIFLIAAIPATIVMLIQAILTLFGFGMDSDLDGDGMPDVDADADDGLGLLSVRGITAFFSVGGWTGFLADAESLPLIFSLLLALTAGLAALIGVAFLMKCAAKLQGSGNLKPENAIGKTATVYLPIPPKGAGRGKITILMQERFIELEAESERSEEEVIPTGESVVVLSLADPQTVVVQRMSRKENAETQNKKQQGGISQWT